MMTAVAPSNDGCRYVYFNLQEEPIEPVYSGDSPASLDVLVYGAYGGEINLS